jgi:hypothetical protein
VAFPLGRLKLATKPSLTGSSPIENTVGIVVVVRLAASAAGTLEAVMTLTCRRTKSSAIAFKRSNWPSAKR